MAYAEIIEEPLDPAAVTPMAPTLDELVAADNIADALSATDLGRIAAEALEDYSLDKRSMETWTARMKAGLDLAELVKKPKDYPWPNASNVKYPLVTTAALQFNAKAYPAIVPGDAVVRAKTFGADPLGQKQARGDRACEFMSYQLMCVVDEWEEDTDKLLTLLPIVGTVVRKVWYDAAQMRIRCRLLDTGAFIVNDKVKTLSDAPRVTEELSLYPSEVKERQRSGQFLNVDLIDVSGEDTQAPQKFIEQHRRIDLDGDGYEEPYIVTVHCGLQRVARIVADFEMRDVKFEQIEVPGQPMPALDPMTGMQTLLPGQPTLQNGKVLSIRRGSYFIAYDFLPSLSGGFWGTGFGLLLGDISETVNSALNLMLDAGHMAALGGGFIGSEFRIKGGSQRFRPGEWKTVNAKGATVRDGLVPMTWPQADPVLFQLLGLLVEAGKEVASIKDILTGDSGGKAMTATTTMALIEQGMAQFTAAFKRIFRALRYEFKLIASINARTIAPDVYNGFHDLAGPDGQPVMLDPAQEFGLDGMDFIPVADPSSVTKMQKIAKGQLLMEAASNGVVDPVAAGQRMLEAAGIEDVEELAPKPDPAQQQMQALQLQAMQAELMLKLVSIEGAIADIEETKTKAMKNMSDVAAQQAGLRLDAVRLGLEAMRAEIERAIAGGLGGMAGASGVPSGPGGAQGVAGPAAGGGIGGMVGGPGMVGGGPAGVPAY